MRSYKLAHQLLSLIEEFEKENLNGELSLLDFSGFLVSKVQNQPEERTADVRLGSNEQQAQQLGYQIDNRIGRLFIYMSRYAKSYIKKALEGTPLQTPEDFTCLAILLTHDSLLKGDLISRNLQEKTSGTEVIRRLIGANLVMQWDDGNDKRSKRIAITQEGKELLYAVFGDMGHVGKLVTGNLSYPEKLNLQYLLQKLEVFHYHLHENKSINTKGDIKLYAKK